MGTGFNYIREIMQMNLPEESTPKPLREYEKEAKRLLNERFGAPKKFHYIGRLIHPISNLLLRAVLIEDKLTGRTRSYLASPNAVVLDCDKNILHTWTGEKWVQFVPGPCTDYDGPNPYEKTVYISTSAVQDSPVVKAIRENFKRSLDANSMIGFYELERVSDTEIVAKYDIKYLGETFTDVRKYHDNRVVWLRHPIRVYNQVRHEANIGEMVEYDGLHYVWNGNQWIEHPKHEKLAMEWPKTNKEDNNMAISMRYLGKSTVSICNGSTDCHVRINDEVIRARPGDLAMYDFELYVFTEDNPMKLPSWKKIGSIEFDKLVRYDKVKPNWLAIDKVVFNAPATIVFWKDGTKTIVKCGDNEAFDPEKGLTMAIAKKAFGNQGNYYNQIKKWLPEPKENDDEVLTLKESLNRIFGDPRIEDAKKKLAAVQELICDMTFRGATKAELVRAIRFSKDLIDFSKGADIDIAESVVKYSIVELEAKYQPKK